MTLLVPFVGVATWFAYHETRTPQNQTEVLNRMMELQREGRYENAVRVVQNWLKDSRRDISHDGLLYQQIAMVYIVKAYKRPGSREESVSLAAFTLEKSLELFEKQELKDNDPGLFGIGGAYEILGDMADKEKCRYYKKAGDTLAQQLPLIKGDSFTAYGRTVPLEPFRAQVRKHLAQVNEKILKSGCQTSLEQ